MSEVENKNVENFEEEQVEEPLDEKTQNALKNLNIDDSAFKKDNDKSNKKNKQKKNTKSKGLDLWEYAKDKGIQVKIQVEENVKPIVKEEKQHYTNNTRTEGNHYNNKHNNHNNNYKGNKQHYNTGYKKNFKQHTNNTFTNKFDNYNNQMMTSGMLNPMMYPNNMRPENTQTTYTNNYNQNYKQNNYPFNLESSLEYYFSKKNLNNDLYLRQKMNEEGFVHFNDVLNLNRLKANAVTTESLLEALPNVETLETVKNEDGEIFIRNKTFSDFSSVFIFFYVKELFSLEQIKQNKLAKKNKPFNYVNMQNNYYYQVTPGVHHNMYPTNEFMSGMMMQGMGMNMAPNMHMMGYPMNMPMHYPQTFEAPKETQNDK